MQAFMPLAPSGPPVNMVFVREAVRTIRLYGKLGVRFGRVHRLCVNSAAEAVRALDATLPGFDAWMIQSKEKGVAYAVFYGKSNIGEEDLQKPAYDEIRIAPVVMGSKSGGLFSIILGAVLIVAGAFISGMSFGAAAPIGGALMKLGWGMVIGGITQLLTPTPRGMSAKDKADNAPSYSFNGPVNTQAQGGCVGLLYGRLIIGSAVISAAISVTDQAYVPTGAAAGGGGNGSGGGGGGGAPPWHVQFG